MIAALTADAFLTLAGRQIVQLSIAIAGAAILSWLFLPRRPQLAYVLWLLVLAKCLAPPLWSSPTGLYSWAQSIRQNHAPAAATESASPTLNVPYETSAPKMLSAPAPGSPPRLMSPERGFWNSSTVLIALWSSGSVVMIIGILIRSSMIRQKLLRFSLPLPIEVTGAIDSLRQMLSIRGPVRAVVCDDQTGPALFGLFSPILVLPAALLQSQTPSQLRPILAHEIMHLRRRDPLVAGLQLFCQCIWWFHPLVWWMNRRINWREKSAVTLK